MNFLYHQSVSCVAVKGGTESSQIFICILKMNKSYY